MHIMHICEFLGSKQTCIVHIWTPKIKKPPNYVSWNFQNQSRSSPLCAFMIQDQYKTPLCISMSFQHQNISPFCIFDLHNKNKPPFKSAFVNSLYWNKHVVYIFQFSWPNEPPICIFEPSKSKQITIMHICDSNIKSETHYAYLNPKIKIDPITHIWTLNIKKNPHYSHDVWGPTMKTKMQTNIQSKIYE